MEHRPGLSKYIHAKAGVTHMVISITSNRVFHWSSHLIPPFYGLLGSALPCLLNTQVPGNEGRKTKQQSLLKNLLDFSIGGKSFVHGAQNVCCS